MTKRDKLIADFRRMKICHGVNLYDNILELRKVEIENFWKRTLFFWGNIALIYVGLFKANLKDYQIVIPLIGLLFNIIFSLSTRGSKYWQEHWETLAAVYENELMFDFFTYQTKEIIRKNSKSILTRPYRFSVSKLTMLLSDLSVLLWIFFWTRELTVLITENILKFQFYAESTEIHWYTIGIITIHLILIGYFLIFLLNGYVYHKYNSDDNKNIYANR